MEVFKIPEVYPLHDGKFVTVPSESWNALCTTISKIIEVVNLHSEKLPEMQSELIKCSDDVSKIATILEEIYEEIV